MGGESIEFTEHYMNQPSPNFKRLFAVNFEANQKLQLLVWDCDRTGKTEEVIGSISMPMKDIMRICAEDLNRREADRKYQMKRYDKYEDTDELRKEMGASSIETVLKFPLSHHNARRLHRLRDCGSCLIIVISITIKAEVKSRM